MKWYRIVDSWGEPYYTGYNETSLREIAECLFSLGDSDDMWNDEKTYGKTEEEIVNHLYKCLEKGERDFIFIVEEQDEPFEAEGDYGGDDDGHNYSAKEITDYVATRKDKGGVFNSEELDNLIYFVWNYGKHKRISDIVDEYTLVDYKDELFDYLNNIAFVSYSEIAKTIEKRFNKEKGITIDSGEVSLLVNQFINWKELYDLDFIG